MLIVVEDGDSHALAAELLNHETVWRFDVLEIDRAESRLQLTDDFGQLRGIGLVHFQIEDVDIRKFFEQDRLAFHDRFRGECADIAQAQRCAAIRDDADEIAPRRQPGGLGRIRDNRPTRFRNAGTVGQREIPLIAERLRRPDRELPGPRLGMIGERPLSERFFVRDFSLRGDDWIVGHERGSPGARACDGQEPSRRVRYRNKADASLGRDAGPPDGRHRTALGSPL